MASQRKFAPLTESRWTLETYFAFVVAATRVHDNVDAELGELMLAAADDDTVEAWAKVHDRANVIGRHDLADRLRQLVRGEPNENGK